MVKNKTCALSIALSNNGNKIAMLCKDRKIRIFRIIDGKLLKTIDESLQKYMDEQLNIKSKTDFLYLDKLDFERRMAVERDLDKQWEYKAREYLNTNSIIPSIGFDESDTFLYFGSLLGIKVVNIKSGETVRVIGKVESTERFLSITLYQGKP